MLIVKFRGPLVVALVSLIYRSTPIYQDSLTSVATRTCRLSACTLSLGNCDYDLSEEYYGRFIAVEHHTRYELPTAIEIYPNVISPSMNSVSL